MRLAIVTFIVILTSTLCAQALEFQPDKVVRLGANVDQIVSGAASQVVFDNYFVAWNSDENTEYRLCVEYDPKSTALAQSNVTVLRAILKFESKPWGLGRNAVTVDVLDSRNSDWRQLAYMPGAERLLADGWTQKKYELNITSQLRQALSSGQSLRIRFSQDNDTDITTKDGKRIKPFDGGTSDQIQVSSGCTVSKPTISVVYDTISVSEQSDRSVASREVTDFAIDPALPDQGQLSGGHTIGRAIALLGGKSGTIRLKKSGQYTIGSNLLIPENVELKVARGAIMHVNPDTKLTIHGYINAGPHQIFNQQGIIDGEVQNSDILPQWFGAKGDGIADDTTCLQQAVDMACRTGVMRVNLGRGHYRLTRTLDCTNSRRPNTIRRDYLQIHGSSFQTQMIGDTGDGHAVIETSGSQWLELHNFKIKAGDKNPSSIGIFAGCPKILPQCQNQVFHLFISLHDDIQANEGLGTIGIWNFAAEEHTYHSMYIAANRPVILTAFNNQPSDPLGMEYKHPMLDLLNVHSLGMTTFSGECFLNAIGRRAPAVTTNCANTIRFENTYIGGSPGAKSPAHAFEVYGSLVSLNYSGVVESLATFMKLHGQLINANATVTFGNITTVNESLLKMGSDAKVVNSTLKFQLEANSNRPLLTLFQSGKAKHNDDWQQDVKQGQVDDIAPTAGLTDQSDGESALINTEIFTNLPKHHLNIAPQVSRLSRDTVIYGANAKVNLR
ncbi:MAG TPA: hypothetical protein DCM28_03295 [Phycisphaerales bacterium]|nr:hypothetical protein [Phycisphaerales bacterium]HCD31334.1 hypothetical protein [Phycisphaerales bacterium]